MRNEHPTQMRELNNSIKEIYDNTNTRNTRKNRINTRTKEDNFQIRKKSNKKTKQNAINE